MEVMTAYPLAIPALAILCGVFLFYSFCRPGLSLAPWVPTRKRDLERILRLAALKSGETFYELGCGDARVARYVARQRPDVHVVGIEMSPILYAIARLLTAFRRLDN